MALLAVRHAQVHRARRGIAARSTLHNAGASTERSLIRERQARRIAEVGRHTAVEPPLHAELARVVARGLDDPRFDFDLRLRPIERIDQRRRALQPAGQVADDDGVGPRIDLDIAARRQRRARQQRRQLGRLGVAERAGQQLELARERALFGELAALPFLVGQHGERRDAHDRPFDRIAQLVIAQDDVERLVPRHFVQRDVDGALHRLVDHDVQPADVRERAQHRPEIRAFEFQRSRDGR